MKRKIIISIIDNNNFYKEGLIMVLSDFFKLHHMAVKFIHGPPFEDQVDIIFHAIRRGATMNYTHWLPVNNHRPLYFSIGNKKDLCLAHLLRDSNSHETLFRHQPVDTVLQAVEQALLFQHCFLPESPKYRTPSAHRPLSLREREVLSYLKQGKNLTETANRMNIKVKTISSHKRSAMRKLNFKRNNELLHWMLQGGLSSQ